MLILSRGPQQSILIGDDIEIVICRIRGNTVRVGIVAPKDVVIRRSELDPMPSSRDSPQSDTPDPFD